MRNEEITYIESALTFLKKSCVIIKFQSGVFKTIIETRKRNNKEILCTFV